MESVSGPPSLWLRFWLRAGSRMITCLSLPVLLMSLFGISCLHLHECSCAIISDRSKQWSSSAVQYLSSLGPQMNQDAFLTDRLIRRRAAILSGEWEGHKNQWQKHPVLGLQVRYSD